MPSLFVADDDELFKRVLKMTLIKYPLFKHVLYFESGLPLINYLKENYKDSNNLPDVLFIDVGMPVCNGWDVLKFLDLYHLAFAKRISIYVISVSIDPRDRDRALRYNFVKDYLYKPLQKEHLAAVANEVKEIVRQ
ncbi:MAG: response regulator [Mucilaginibacter sp.]